MNIIDRRANPKGISLGNRQRFIAREKDRLTKAAIDSLITRKPDEKGGISVPIGDTAEPAFHHNQGTGRRDQVFPGNKEYVRGDEIPRSQRRAGGIGSQGSPDGSGQDFFEFILSQSECLDLIFNDLALPDLVKTQLMNAEKHEIRRAGFSITGSRLDVKRTLLNAKGRNIALKRPSLAAREEAKRQADFYDEDDLSAKAVGARAKLDSLERRAKIIPYIDPIDVRNRHFEQEPQPNTQAVMFCLMDVSQSMTKEMKMLAKRFFMLLNIFLKKNYQKVDVVFIRHTNTAQEVDEKNFFYGKETGSTVVSSALQKMLDIVKERYPAAAWNIYGSQASDGDNYGADNQLCAQLLDKILPLSQHFAYVEVGNIPARNASDLWRGYASVQPRYRQFAMRRVLTPSDIFPVFRELFASKDRLKTAAYSSVPAARFDGPSP